MQVCPSGALQQLPVNQIQIGLAEVNHDTCLRIQGIDCTYCVDSCPIGETAIRLDSRKRIQVIPEGCVGCGVCQYECPTSPKSVIVTLLTKGYNGTRILGELMLTSDLPNCYYLRDLSWRIA